MPRRRSAIALALAESNTSGNVRASKMAKSLPKPCIFRNAVIWGLIVLANRRCQSGRCFGAFAIVGWLIFIDMGAKCLKQSANEEIHAVAEARNGRARPHRRTLRHDRSDRRCRRPLRLARGHLRCQAARMGQRAQRALAQAAEERSRLPETLRLHPRGP